MKIGWEEIESVFRKLKKGKAAGKNEIQNEVWIWGGKRLKEALWEICRRVWRKESFLDR